MRRDTSENAYTQPEQPPVTRLGATNYSQLCQREDTQTVHLDHSKPVSDGTQANQAALVKFQLKHNLSLHKTASEVIDLLHLDSPSEQTITTDEGLAKLAKHLSDFRTRIRTDAQDEFQDQQLARLTAKIVNQQPADTLTLKGHATQMVMIALRNTLIEQGVSLIEHHLKRHAATIANQAALQALLRLATAIELLEVTRFNSLLAYHDIDHTLWVIQGSMAIVGDAYDHAIEQLSVTLSSGNGNEHQANEMRRTLIKQKQLSLHKSMLFSAAHDSFFEFKPNTIVRSAGRREDSSSEGISAKNLKKLLRKLAARLNHEGIMQMLASAEFSEDIDEAIFATVPTFTSGTVINGAHALAADLHTTPTNFLERIATAIADLEECLLPDPARFISKSLLLNQEGTPIVDMSLIEHRSGVLLALYAQDDELIKSALADQNSGADFAEALNSWHTWMANQLDFVKGRQRKTVNLINLLIQQWEMTQPPIPVDQTDKDEGLAPSNAKGLIFSAQIEGLIKTLLDRYAKAGNADLPPIPEAKVTQVTAQASQTQNVQASTVLWKEQLYHINNAGALAARQVVIELEAQLKKAQGKEEKLIALASVLRKNLTPQINRLYIPRAENLGRISSIPNITLKPRAPDLIEEV